jgi:hypothetical protein
MGTVVDVKSNFLEVSWHVHKACKAGAMEWNAVLQKANSLGQLQ